MSTHTQSHPLLQNLPSGPFASSSAFLPQRDARSAGSAKRGARSSSNREPRPTKAAQLRMAAAAAKKEKEQQRFRSRGQKAVSNPAMQTKDASLFLKDRADDSDALTGDDGRGTPKTTLSRFDSGGLGYSCEPTYPSQIQNEFTDIDDSLGTQMAALMLDSRRGNDRDIRSESTRERTNQGSRPTSRLSMVSIPSEHSLPDGMADSTSRLVAMSSPDSATMSSRSSLLPRLDTTSTFLPPPSVTRTATAPGLALSWMKPPEQHPRPGLAFRSVGIGFAHDGSSKPMTVPVRYPKEARGMLLQYAFSISPISSVMVTGSQSGPTVPSLYVTGTGRDEKSAGVTSPVTPGRQLPAAGGKSPAERVRTLEIGPQTGGTSQVSNPAEMHPALSLFGTSTSIPGVFQQQGYASVAQPVPYQIFLQTPGSGASGLPGLPVPFTFLPSTNGIQMKEPEEQMEETNEIPGDTESPRSPRKPTKRELNADIRLGGLGPDFLSEEYQKKVRNFFDFLSFFADGDTVQRSSASLKPSRHLPIGCVCGTRLKGHWQSTAEGRKRNRRVFCCKRTLWFPAQQRSGPGQRLLPYGFSLSRAFR